MQKLGIITYFYFYNYGTMLQGLATRLLFDKMGGIGAELIDYRFAEKTHLSKSALLLIRLKRIFVYIKEFKRVFYTAKYASDMSRRNSLFDAFAKKHLKLSSARYLYESDLTANPPAYDIYLTGSDQTWSPKIGFSPALFLDFAPKSSIKAAYAPSLGVSSLNDDECSYLKESLKKYDFLSCRETLGSKLLEDITSRKVETVLDPTLMISSNQWLQYAATPDVKGEYILCYFLGDRDYYRNYVKQLSKQTHLPVYYLPVNWKDFRTGNNLLWDVGPAEFIGLLANAKYVCTDSFHGTLFGVNFHKEVRVFLKHKGNVKGGDNSRLYDIVQRLGIEDQLITDYRLGEKVSESIIDYSSVEEKLHAEREKSMEYVKRIVEALNDRNLQ